MTRATVTAGDFGVWTRWLSSLTVNEAARRCVKAKTSAWSRRDLAILSAGAKFTF